MVLKFRIHLGSCAAAAPILLEKIILTPNLAASRTRKIIVIAIVIAIVIVIKCCTCLINRRPEYLLIEITRSVFHYHTQQRLFLWKCYKYIPNWFDNLLLYLLSNIFITYFSKQFIVTNESWKTSPPISKELRIVIRCSVPRLSVISSKVYST